MDRKTIYFVAGEASGDNHGAALLRALHQENPALEFIGRGGPQMKASAGENFHDWIERAAVVGLWDVLKHYGYFREQFRQALAEVARAKPDAVVLIDYPGFNLRLARALRRRGVKKLIYYISPQVWAWNRGRIKKMARYLDLMLCIFPFEADLYNPSGLRTIFVGHPMIERLAAKKIDAPRDPNLVAFFPGSRRREVQKIFPIMLETMERLWEQNRALTFDIGAASSAIAHRIQKIADAAGGVRQRIRIRVGDGASIMQRAVVGLIASGSATLEAAYFRLPFLLIYKVPWLTYVTARMVVKVNYLGMPNVLANKEVAPEFIQHKAQANVLTNALLRLLNDPSAREAMAAEFGRIIGSLDGAGASERAAKAILGELGGVG